VRSSCWMFANFAAMQYSGIDVATQHKGREFF
jgi:hypothetical protein